MQTNLLFTESPDCPTFGQGNLMHGVVTDSDFRSVMPVIAVRLDNEPGLFKHKVWLPPPEHSSVHDEPEASFLKLGVKGNLNGGHLTWIGSSKPFLAYLFPRLFRDRMAAKFLPHPDDGLRRMSATFSNLGQFLASLRRGYISFMRRTYLSAAFGRKVSASRLCAFFWPCPAPCRSFAHPLTCFW